MNTNRVLIVMAIGLLALGGCSKRAIEVPPSPFGEELDDHKVAVFLKGDYQQYDLRFHLPEWAQAAKSPEDADWIIDYEAEGTYSQDRPGNTFLKTFFWTYLFTVATEAIIVISYDGEIDPPETDDEKRLAYGYVPGGLGFLIGVRAALRSTDVIDYYNLKGFVSNTITGDRTPFSSTSLTVSGDIERLLRLKARDQKAPELITRNLSDQEREIIQSPFLNLEFEASDDVELLEVHFTTKNYSDSVSLAGLTTYRVTKPIPLNVGDNVLTVLVTDLYGKSTEKQFQIFRTRGSSVKTAEEFIITKSVDFILNNPDESAEIIKECIKDEVYYILGQRGEWYQIWVDASIVGWTQKSNGKIRERGPEQPVAYPPLLSITDITFKDEASDGFLDAGEGGTFSFNIVNHGKGFAEDIKINVDVPSQSGIGISPIEVPTNVDPDESVEAKYTLIAGATVPTQEVTITISALDRLTRSPAPSESYRIKSRGRWSDVDIDIPQGRISNPNGIAVIIGNRDYSSPETFNVEFALSDAEIMKNHAVQALRFREENIIYSPNTSLSQMRHIFGSEQDPEGRLHKMVLPNKSDVFVFYSGHGAPGIGNRRGYLLPIDAKGDEAQQSGYPLDLLIRNLGQLPAKSVTLVVDACFSGKTEPGSLIPKASGPSIEVTYPSMEIQNGNLFFACRGNEISSWYPEKKHGLFTYFFLKGLRGEADRESGNSDNKVTVEELAKYLSENVPYRASRLIGRDQEPVITTSQGGNVLVQY